ncbi:MAG: glycosyl transferase [Oscillospiraceae bacterium]|jgi:processive 1,2-diacylglycerol beta-glucosyltransferase|nr:glycosyl transferase [Oscillospiraceae bacterium]
MKTLIFPTSTGQGHNCASLAVKEALESLGATVRVEDALDAGKQKSQTVSRLYDTAVRRVPRLFGALYGLAERISSSKRHSPVYYANALYARSVLERINAFEPDAIVCPHMFSAHAVSFLRAKHGLTIPSVGIITDYTCSPFWEECGLDSYIVANEEVAGECASKGMDKGKLFPLGIPVSARFSQKRDKKAARAELGIMKEQVFVVMGGSMGFGSIPETAALLVRSVPEAQVVAVCGSNADALEQARAIEGVIAMSFTNKVETLMDAADVLLTKPGGLTTTEAMVKRVPLVMTSPIPGGEARNAEFIARMGMGLIAHSAEEAVKAAVGLLADKGRCERMLAAQERLVSQTAAADAAVLIRGMIERKGGDRECGRAS